LAVRTAKPNSFSAMATIGRPAAKAIASEMKQTEAPESFNADNQRTSSSLPGIIKVLRL
jgi:hypothetical protein